MIVKGLYNYKNDWPKSMSKLSQARIIQVKSIKSMTKVHIVKKIIELLTVL